MPGVGKTLPVKEVSRQVQEGKLLDSMVMAIVSSTRNIQKIQDQIAMLLVLKIEEKSTIVVNNDEYPQRSCLLLDGNSTNEEYCDAHDLTYIVVKSIASKNNSVFTLAEEDVLRDWLDGESMKICNKICLLCPIITKLPD
ncbi:hypothetical protein Golax_015234 [Gossypium laxum]|uniref:NB-ARC domain-containing protein n=1 Tax=Gossypium laxum TaxID=34288 RepID=A0A7J8ZXT6_9ROSI|nr:hypothetical protein [Gossypium laxum]